MSTDINDLDKVAGIDIKDKVTPHYNRAELIDLMSNYGQQRADHEHHFNRYCLLLNQGVAALLLTILLAAANSWPPLTMAIALIATWRLIQCFSIDEHCETLETNTTDAKTILDHALSIIADKTMLPELYQEFDNEPYQGHLAFYLPGPVEVRRRKTGFQLSRLLFS